MLLRENEQYKRIFIRYRLRIILNENQKNLDNIYFEIIGIRLFCGGILNGMGLCGIIKNGKSKWWS